MRQTMRTARREYQLLEELLEVDRSHGDLREALLIKAWEAGLFAEEQDDRSLRDEKCKNLDLTEQNKMQEEV
jgi:hypothetical protein